MVWRGTSIAQVRGAITQHQKNFSRGPVEQRQVQNPRTKSSICTPSTKRPRLRSFQMTMFQRNLSNRMVPTFPTHCRQPIPRRTTPCAHGGPAGVKSTCCDFQYHRLLQHGYDSSEIICMICIQNKCMMVHEQTVCFKQSTH